jgi:DNA-binding response OmpR family regulator
MCFNGEVIELRPKTTEFLYTLFSKYPKYATVADFTFAMWGAHDEGIDVKENIRVYVSNCRRFLAPLNIKIEGLWGEARYRLVLPK